MQTTTFTATAFGTCITESTTMQVKIIMSKIEIVSNITETVNFLLWLMVSPWPNWLSLGIIPRFI
jgi:hypothetical protein